MTGEVIHTSKVVLIQRGALCSGIYVVAAQCPGAVAWLQLLLLPPGSLSCDLPVAYPMGHSLAKLLELGSCNYIVINHASSYPVGVLRGGTISQPAVSGW